MKRKEIYLKAAESIYYGESIHMCGALRDAAKAISFLDLNETPEFELFKPDFDELRREGIPIKCSAWMDYNDETQVVREIILLLCAAMTKD